MDDISRITNEINNLTSRFNVNTPERNRVLHEILLDLKTSTLTHFNGSEEERYTIEELFAKADKQYSEFLSFYYDNGYKFGIAMYKEVKGWGSGDIRAKLANAFSTGPDCIIGLIQGFNHQAKDSGQKIMEYIDNEWGPTAGEMDRIPNSLLERARHNKLESTAEYKALEAAMKKDNSFTGDYGTEKARAIDNAMVCLINLIIKAEKPFFGV